MPGDKSISTTMGFVYWTQEHLKKSFGEIDVRWLSCAQEFRNHLRKVKDHDLF